MSLQPTGVRKGSTRTSRTRPLAVRVKRGDEDFPELLKSVRGCVDMTVTRTAIAKLKQAKSGGLLIEINRGAESAEVVKAEDERDLGPKATVRKMDDVAVIELCDLDDLITADVA